MREAIKLCLYGALAAHLEKARQLAMLVEMIPAGCGIGTELRMTEGFRTNNLRWRGKLQTIARPNLSISFRAEVDKR